MYRPITLANVGVEVIIQRIAGKPEVKLVASNDMDEHLIENLVLVQKADYDIYAAGT